jgi:hypothetical protein
MKMASPMIIAAWHHNAITRRARQGSILSHSCVVHVVVACQEASRHFQLRGCKTHAMSTMVHGLPMHSVAFVSPYQRRAPRVVIAWPLGRVEKGLDERRARLTAPSTKLSKAPTTLTTRCTPPSATGIGSRRPSCGDARRSPSANSSVNMFTAFAERRTRNRRRRPRQPTKRRSMSRIMAM